MAVLSCKALVAPATEPEMVVKGLVLLTRIVNGVAAEVRIKILHEVSVTPPTIGPWVMVAWAEQNKLAKQKMQRRAHFIQSILKRKIMFKTAKKQRAQSLTF